MTTLVPAPRSPLRSVTDPIRLRRYDLVLLGAVTLLCVIGCLLVWSATRTRMMWSGASQETFLVRDILNMSIGAVLLFSSARVDSRLLRLIGPVLYVGSVLGLVAVLLIGTTINGARAWIEVGGGFEIQPAEFAKLGVIAAVAVLFGDQIARRGPDAAPKTIDLFRALLIAGIPLGLIMMQPDLGSAMVLSAVTFAMLFAANVPARWLLALAAGAVVVVVVAVMSGFLAKYQVDRITAFTDPSRDPQGIAYNFNQADIAIAHGGALGQGLFDGLQTQGGFVPEQQTDFVFSAAGEELGWIGSGVIILLFGVIIWRGLSIALNARGIARLTAVGIVGWIGFQTFENIGMNLGLTPVTGVPLPFLSYGGSSLFALAIAVGLLQSIHRRTRF
jgi:rod shape determining protein RodA